MRKLVISVSLIAGMIFGLGAGIAAPGPNGKNNHGLCTAYFNGSQNGMDNKRNAGPFSALEAAASDGDPETDAASDVWAWCLPGGAGNNEKGIGGNPTDPTDPNSTPPGGGGGGSTEQASAKGGKKK